MIGLVTPHLFSIDGTPSPNIGDRIIYNYLSKELKSIFPSEVFYDFPLHASLNRYHKFLLTKADFIFVTGSNFLTPRLDGQRKALVSLGDLGIHNKVIFLGGGWSGTKDHNFDRDSIELYKKILHKDYPHSVRDSLSYEKTSVIGRNVINTSCPTMWSLSSKKYNRSKSLKDCLFTLTDYSIDIEQDQNFLNLLIDGFDKLYYFPQGKHDLAYLNSLSIFKDNRAKFIVIERSLDSLDDFIQENKFTYVGTRLHCGIHVLNSGNEALILEVDNRAKYITQDTNLPVCRRQDTSIIKNWLDGNEVFTEFSLPKSWNQWKESFKN